jgi:hypothetical protein
MTKKDKLESLLMSMESDTKIPSGLADRINACVAKQAPYIERKVILMTAGLGLFSMMLTFYAITDFTVYVLQTELFTLLGAIVREPSMFFSGVGFNALMERMPILSILVFIISTLFFARSLSKLVYFNNQSIHEKVA